MVQWHNFVQPDDWQPEIRVGPYEYWIGQLGHGPSQAERVLTHTPMMEVAHERRFVVSELELDISDFEVKHCERINSTITQLHDHFEQHANHITDHHTTTQDHCLLGLASSPTKLHANQPTICEFAAESKTPCPPETTPNVWYQSMAATSPLLLVDMDHIAVDDSENTDEENQQRMLHTLHQACIHQRQHQHQSKQPRQYVAKRIRKYSKQSVIEDHNLRQSKRRKKQDEQLAFLL